MPGIDLLIKSNQQFGAIVGHYALLGGGCSWQKPLPSIRRSPA
jgi:hypothetical protein